MGGETFEGRLPSESDQFQQLSIPHITKFLIEQSDGRLGDVKGMLFGCSIAVGICIDKTSAAVWSTRMPSRYCAGRVQTRSRKLQMRKAHHIDREFSASVPLPDQPSGLAGNSVGTLSANAGHDVFLPVNR